MGSAHACIHSFIHSFMHSSSPYHISTTLPTYLESCTNTEIFENGSLAQVVTLVCSDELEQKKKNKVFCSVSSSHFHGIFFFHLFLSLSCIPVWYARVSVKKREN